MCCAGKQFLLCLELQFAVAHSLCRGSLRFVIDCAEAAAKLFDGGLTAV